MVRVDNIWLKLLDCGMQKARNRQRHRKCRPVELPYRWDSHDIAGRSRSVKLGRHHQHAMTNLAELSRKLVNTPRNPAHMREVGIGQHQNVHFLESLLLQDRNWSKIIDGARIGQRSARMIGQVAKRMPLWRGTTTFARHWPTTGICASAIAVSAHGLCAKSRDRVRYRTSMHMLGNERGRSRNKFCQPQLARILRK